MIPKKCPRCGSTTAMSYPTALGTCSVEIDLEDYEILDMRMPDVFSFRGGGWLYCAECGKRIGPSKELTV